MNVSELIDELTKNNDHTPPQIDAQIMRLQTLAKQYGTSYFECGTLVQPVKGCIYDETSGQKRIMIVLETIMHGDLEVNDRQNVRVAVTCGDHYHIMWLEGWALEPYVQELPEGATRQ